MGGTLLRFPHYPHGTVVQEIPMKNPHMQTKRPHLRVIRVRNRALLLRQLHKHGAVSRHDLRDRTGLTQASISRITRELITEGICFEDHSYHAHTKLGRRRADLRVNPEGGYVIAICLSAFSRMIVVADLAGQNHHHVKIPTSQSKTAVDAIDFVGAYIDDLIAKGSIKSNRILGASLSIAGSIDPNTGHLAHAPFLN